MKAIGLGVVIFLIGMGLLVADTLLLQVGYNWLAGAANWPLADFWSAFGLNCVFVLGVMVLMASKEDRSPPEF